MDVGDKMIWYNAIYVGRKSLLDMLQASTENFNKTSWLVIRFQLCYFSVEAFIVNTCNYTKRFWGNNQGRVRSETNVLEISLSLVSVQWNTIRCWFSVSESSNRMLLPNFCNGQLEGGIKLSGCTVLVDLEIPRLSISLVYCCSTWQSKSLCFSFRGVKIWKIMRPTGPEM